MLGKLAKLQQGRDVGLSLHSRMAVLACNCDALLQSVQASGLRRLCFVHDLGL